MEAPQVENESENLELEIDDAFSEAFDEFGEEPSNEVKEAAIQEVIEQNPSFSEEQIRDLFDQNNQRLFGKIGEIIREVKRLDEFTKSSIQPREAQPIQVTPEMFSTMREEFGEDFAAALAKDLSQIPLSQQANGIDQTQIDYLLEQRIAQIENNFEIKLVAREHPDWESIAQSQDFDGWKSQLPADIQDRLNTTWDSSFISAAISAYKRDKALHQEQQNKKQDRLEAAVMPTSTKGFDDDYTDDFEEGFNSD